MSGCPRLPLRAAFADPSNRSVLVDAGSASHGLARGATHQRTTRCCAPSGHQAPTSMRSRDASVAARTRCGSALASSGLHRPAPRRRWSASEDAIVRDGYANGLSCDEVAAALAQRTPTAVAARARRLGLATYARRWTVEDDIRLRRILPRCSVDHAARLLSRTPEGVRRRARRLGLASPRPPEVTHAGARWTPDEDGLLRLHAALNPAVLGTLLGRSDHAVVRRLRRLGLRAGRFRSPHHPSSSNGGLTPGQRALVEREFRDKGGRAVLSLEARLQRPLGDAVPNLVRRARAGAVRLD